MSFVIALNPRDPLPLYAQLERGIKAAIAGGTLEVGAQLPTVRQLAVAVKINANTVAKVYAELERQSVLTTRRGVGTFVAPTAASNQKRDSELRALTERFLAEAAVQGFTSQEVQQEIQRLSQSP